jgi:hypothetical protein
MAKAIPDAAREQTIRRRNRWNRWRFIMVLPFLFWCTWSPWFRQRAAEPSRVAVMTDEDVPDIGFSKDVLRNWAQYSPYIPAAQYVNPPPGCVVKQVRSHVPLFLDFGLIAPDALGKLGMGYYALI